MCSPSDPLALIASIPDASFVMLGAVIAAMITGAISYVSLIVTKEQNVAKMRSEWIQSLIANLAIMFSEMELILRLIEPDMVDGKQGLDRASLKYLRETNKVEYRHLNESINNVRLRLDVTIEKHKEIWDAVNNLRNNFYGDCKNLKQLLEMQEKLTENAQILTQETWSTIKQGDKPYRHLKGFLLISLLTIFVSGVTLLIHLGLH